jgi:hypothetical protein
MKRADGYGQQTNWRAGFLELECKVGSLKVKPVYVNNKGGETIYFI